MLIPEDGALIHAQGFHAALRGKKQTDNPYVPGGPKFRTLNGSDLVWNHGWELGNAEKGKKKK